MLLYQSAPGRIRVDRTADRLGLTPDQLLRFLNIYVAGGILKSVRVYICPETRCDSIIELSDDGYRFACDLCDKHYSPEETKIETAYLVIGQSVSFDAEEIEFDVEEIEDNMPESAALLTIGKITPWNNLDIKDFLVVTPNIGQLDSERVLSNLEKHGICLLRVVAQEAADYVVNELAKFIGTPCKRQNKFRGTLKLIQPKEEVPANTGDTIKNLGPHVDGTQHPKQPVSLIFQYIADAKIGAQSLFYDMAKVLLDIPEAKRNQLLFNLARPDAATFSKSGMEYVGQFSR